ncbi:MAG TPA: nucleotide exchange factor GrpE [Anaeromyxobacteraceae bacterium]|nr:nucleotide exchange factor GrpE [Anaeromyxobacteraceae bacterium]
MPDHKEQGAFSADIPDDAVAEAVAAVERRARVAPPPAAADPAPVTPATEGAAPGATSTGPGDPSPLRAEVDQLRAELELSQERARKVFEQLKDEHDRLLRTAADLENYKKRAAREKEEVQRHGNERLVKELLPVLDALERALAAAPQGDPVATGVAMTRRLFEEALARFGVKGFSAKGETFDPQLHEALMTVTTVEVEPGLVVDEQQRGYFLHDRLIRPAAVVVSAAPPPAEAPGEARGSPEGT